VHREQTGEYSFLLLYKTTKFIAPFYGHTNIQFPDKNGIFAALQPRERDLRFAATGLSSSGLGFDK
jgi:hypothetical protein